MTRHSTWYYVIQKVQSCLSRWKANTLSIGGRLTLLKSVLGPYFLNGCGVINLKMDPYGVISLELCMVTRLTVMVIDLLPVRVQFFGKFECLKIKVLTFFPIVKFTLVLQTKFWLDVWVSDMALCDRFPRIFALETVKEVLVADKMEVSPLCTSFRRPIRDGVERQQWLEFLHVMNSVTLSSSPDRWSCDINGEGSFAFDLSLVESPMVYVRNVAEMNAIVDESLLHP
nr:RNA-directed DNA polymerase, eukaryota, reverse transcriptase zinc-binding domain protein [Tanacetum cinerariifolium]